jgi:hypothetical protein
MLPTAYKRLRADMRTGVDADLLDLHHLIGIGRKSAQKPKGPPLWHNAKTPILDTPPARCSRDCGESILGSI